MRDESIEYRAGTADLRGQQNLLRELHGTKQKRLAAIKGDEITWTNPTSSIGGNTVTMLQRAKSGERHPQRDEK
jgi:hypothetical protein